MLRVPALRPSGCVVRGSSRCASLKRLSQIQCDGRTYSLTCIRAAAAAPPPPPPPPESGDGKPGFKFSNPFGRDQKKQDAAKEALKQALGGQKDILADVDKRIAERQKRMGGSGGGGDNGGGGWFGGFDFNEFGDNMRGGFISFFQGLAAFLALAGVIVLACFFKPITGFAANTLRWILRLDGPSRRPVAATPAPSLTDLDDSEQLDAVTDSILDKYGGADADVFHNEDDGGADQRR